MNNKIFFGLLWLVAGNLSTSSIAADPAQIEIKVTNRADVSLTVQGYNPNKKLIAPPITLKPLESTTLKTTPYYPFNGARYRHYFVFGGWPCISDLKTSITSFDLTQNQGNFSCKPSQETQ